MEKKEIIFNNQLMNEIGLEVGPGNRLYDQETGSQLIVRGKEMISPGSMGSRDTVEFDPYNSTFQMHRMFDYFAHKYENESGVSIDVTYIEDDKAGGARLTIKDSDNNTYSSKNYKRDTLRYADIIMQLNGDEDVDLTEYDTPRNNSNMKGSKKTSTTKKKGSK